MYVLFFFKKEKKNPKTHSKVSVNLYSNPYLPSLEFSWYSTTCDFFVILNIKCNCM